MSDPPTNFLDIEDDDQRQKRIGALLERLDTTSPIASSSTGPPSSFLNIGEKPSPGPIEPPAALLARVRKFLPDIAASNEALFRQRRQDIDIEHVPKGDQYIEMNLGLGVFEAKLRPDHDADAPSPSASSEADSDSNTKTGTSSSSSGSESESDEGESDEYSSSDVDGDWESESGSEFGSEVNIKPIISSRPVKPLPRRVSQQARPNPEV